MLPWTPIVGARAAAGLQWLEETAGQKAVWKFLGGKIRGTPFSGRYLNGISDRADGRELICELIRMLRQGQTIPVCDVDSYYAHGKQWSLGMAIYRGKLVDVWAGKGPDASLEARS